MRPHPTTAPPVSQPGGLDVHHRGCETAHRGIFQARFGSRTSVGSEVSESHVLRLTRGSPSSAPEDTSLSFEGRQCLQKSLQSHQPNAHRPQEPARVWGEVSSGDKSPKALTPGAGCCPCLHPSCQGSRPGAGMVTVPCPEVAEGSPCWTVTTVETKLSSSLVCSFLYLFFSFKRSCMLPRSDK